MSSGNLGSRSNMALAAPTTGSAFVPTTVRFERTRGAPVESLDLVTKINPIEGLPGTLIPWVIRQQGIALDRSCA
jgi:hypothetical protein